MTQVNYNYQDKTSKYIQSPDGSLKFIGVYATTSALQTAYPNGASGVALVTADGYTYYWSNNLWTKGPLFQSAGITDGTINVSSLSDRVLSVISNSYRAYDITLGTLDGTTGNESTVVNTRYRSTFIKVKTGDVLNFVQPAAPSGLTLSVYLYDVNKAFQNVNYVSLVNGSGAYTFLADGYCKLYFVGGSTDLTNYKDACFSSAKITSIDFANTLSSTKFNTSDYFNTGKNLFNKAVIFNGYLNTDGVTLLANSSYYTSDFMPVKASQPYIGKMLRKLALYDVNKKFLTFTDINPNVDTTFTPTVDGYARISYNTTYLNTMQVEKGTALTSYEAFYYDFNYPRFNSSVLNNINPLATKVLLVLGDSIARGANNNNTAYGELIATNNGMNIYNYAIGGATLGDYTATDPTRSYINKQLNDFIAQHPGLTPDYILLEGYTNDILMTPLGAKTTGYADALDTKTMSGGLEGIIKQIKTSFTTSKLLFVCTHNMSSRDATLQKSYHDTAVDICNKWSVPVVDLYKEGGLNTNISVHQTTYTDTGTHPTLDGYNLFYVPLITAKMKAV